MMKTPAPPITGVAEVVLSVRDIPTMRTFYVDVMGFNILSEAASPRDPNAPDAGEPTITFLTIRELDTPMGRRCHPEVLVLIDHRRHASGRPGHEVSTSTLHHLAFEIPTESYHDHHQRLQSLGLDPIEVEFDNISAKSLFFKDPEGNSLELICPA